MGISKNGVVQRPHERTPRMKFPTVPSENRNAFRLVQSLCIPSSLGVLCSFGELFSDVDD